MNDAAKPQTRRASVTRGLARQEGSQHRVYILAAPTTRQLRRAEREKPEHHRPAQKCHTTGVRLKRNMKNVKRVIVKGRSDEVQPHTQGSGLTDTQTVRATCTNNNESRRSGQNKCAVLILQESVHYYKLVGVVLCGSSRRFKASSVRSVPPARQCTGQRGPSAAQVWRPGCRPLPAGAAADGQVQTVGGGECHRDA
ncbi:hypothetical protein E2C01_019411 [Portunus trituberculatus]|uniref:Uncharacterized protein n=1 Tax=Portunus trituberculatus TaxID=210409 RepID=A0A5B7DY70_PORTR|nr:hypothetical protein [Portunus trituberculatus]